MTSPERALLEEIYASAVIAAHPSTLMMSPAVLALLGGIDAANGRVGVVGAGKAAASMAAALETAWAGLGHEAPLPGIVATRDGYICDTHSIVVAPASHPSPDERSEIIAGRMMAIADELGEGDTMIGLWSGGGSSLLAAPPEGARMGSLRLLTNMLLKSGAPISDLNVVRRHLSAIAGGRLARRAAPARVINIILPDVVKETSKARWLADIASGPGVPDPTSAEDAMNVIDQLGLRLTPDLRHVLQSASAETPSFWEEIGAREEDTLVFGEDIAVESAKALLRERGFRIADAPSSLTGEARDVAKDLAKHAKELAASGEPSVLVTGGELTVSVRGSGRGGPNQEFALALAIALDGAPNIIAVSGDTDGIDGVGDAAGALISPDTLERLRAAGIDPHAALEANDAGSAFAAIGDLLVTGPTFTNVNDLRLIVING